MNPNKMLLTFPMALLAVVAFAEEAAENAAGDADAPAVAPAVKAPQPKTFTTLPFCRRIEGTASVRPPNGEWVVAEEGKFYPFGTAYRAEPKSTLVVAFGPAATVTVADGSAFATRPQPLDATSRAIVLMNGLVDVKLPDNLPEGRFVVSAPGFLAKNPAGESSYMYEDKGDGDRAVVRCKTGSMGLEGRHFDIPEMHAANELVIRTSRDQLFTSLSGTSGDFVVKVDQGVRTKEEIGDDGQVSRSLEKATLDWHLSPRTKVVINRALPAIGQRMSVHTMAFDAAGERKSECSFCEGLAEINSGELVPKVRAGAEEIAKRAAEVTETTEAEPEEDGEKADDKAENKTTSTEEE